jgi:phosphatidylglycerol---prolipoprotein diacylglyceryl transferase
MVEINWNPVPHVGVIPVNWYGITMMFGFLTGGYLTLHWAPKANLSRTHGEELLIWIIIGTVMGARIYFLLQNDVVTYLHNPVKILAVWEGGLAFFGGLMGATLAAFVYTWREGLSFPHVADLFAPAIPIGAAIGRVNCGLAGMDYGTPTHLPWGVIYTHANSYAPLDGVGRHPVQFYELAGDLIIAGILIKLRGKLQAGGLFLTYLILFSFLRFFLFFLRGDVNPVGLGLKNAQWTALFILLITLPFFILSSRKWQKSINLNRD